MSKETFFPNAQHDGFMLFLSLDNIVSLVVFCSCTECACHRNCRVHVFTVNGIPIMCICDVVQVLVSPPVLTDMTSSMVVCNLRYRTFRVVSLLKDLRISYHPFTYFGVYVADC